MFISLITTGCFKVDGKVHSYEEINDFTENYNDCIEGTCNLKGKIEAVSEDTGKITYIIKGTEIEFLSYSECALNGMYTTDCTYKIFTNYNEEVMTYLLEKLIRDKNISADHVRSLEDNYNKNFEFLVDAENDAPKIAEYIVDLVSYLNNFKKEYNVNFLQKKNDYIEVSIKNSYNYKVFSIKIDSDDSYYLAYYNGNEYERIDENGITQVLQDYIDENIEKLRK